MPRGKNWSHDETLFLALEKLSNDEDGMWEGIAVAVSERIDVAYPERIDVAYPKRSARSADACRNRWDVLVKVYNAIESSRKHTIGGRHVALRDNEIKSLKQPYRSDWYIIVKEVCDLKLATKNAKRAKIQHAASTSGESKKLSEGTAAGWSKWDDEATLTKTEQESEPEVDPEIAQAMDLDHWQLSEQVIGSGVWPELEQALEQAREQVFEQDFDLKFKQEIMSQRSSEYEQGCEQACEQEAEQVKRPTVHVPNIVEVTSPSHMQHLGAPHIAGQHTIGVSESSDWALCDSNLLQKLQDMSNMISSASNNEGDTEQRKK